MKDVKKKLISESFIKDVKNPVKLLNNIKNLTVEDVIVMYAYAEAIVETVREPLIILDKKLCIKTANKAFFDTFKVAKKDTYNESIFDLGNGQWNIPSLKKLLKEILPKNTQFNDYEVTHRFEDIGEHTMLLNARRIVLEGHKTELILLAIEDVTAKKAIDQQKDDFIGFVSHELRTPLTTIKAFIQLLQKNNEKNQDTKNIHLLGKVAKQVDRMGHMISSFMNAYSLQTGKLVLHKQIIPINQIIDEVLETFEFADKTHLINRHGIVTASVLADKERISQVLTNLLTNAIKYSPSADQVIIDATQDSKNVIISVQDFGMGIPKEQQEHIFDRFYRARGKKRKCSTGSWFRTLYCL